MTSADCSRMAWTASRLALIDSSESQLVVMMHRPESRSRSMDRPMQPGMVVTAGMTSSRM